MKESIWFDNECVFWHSVPDGWYFGGELEVSTPNYYPERLESIKKHGLARAALFVIEDLVTSGLRGRVQEQMTWDAMSEKLVLRVRPGNLIGALWLQLAHAIERGNKYTQCLVCARWIQIAIGRGRQDKKYCSDACRMRAYRKRIAQRKAES